jgi:hypothetical protein
VTHFFFAAILCQNKIKNGCQAPVPCCPLRSPSFLLWKTTFHFAIVKFHIAIAAQLFTDGSVTIPYGFIFLHDEKVLESYPPNMAFIRSLPLYRTTQSFNKVFLEGQSDQIALYHLQHYVGTNVHIDRGIAPLGNSPACVDDLFIV